MNFRNLRKLNNDLHRDLGYFFSTLIIVYSLSGLALNHVDDWNPDFVIQKDTISIPAKYNFENISDQNIIELSKLINQNDFKLYDSPTTNQIKIYYEDASFHIDFSRRLGLYEVITKRILFYEVNVLHRNSLKEWKWFSDIFAVALILINITGLFILKGKNGFLGRGKWFLAAGFLPPIIAIIIFTIN
ncbi:MAG: PepSY-associated TM helix domain-containing protein [Ignavibacteriae bacterium]|nr:PepSY-associated TM helix domain-containing protein [Ignavibacteriota bacterium]